MKRLHNKNKEIVENCAGKKKQPTNQQAAKINSDFKKRP